MNQKYFTYITIVAIVLSPIASAHQFYVTLFNHHDPDGTRAISVTDGRDWFTATRADGYWEESPGEPDENGDPGPPVITGAWTQYSITVPDTWGTELRGVSFMVPGDGLTGFYPIPAAGTDLQINVYSGRVPPNPDAYTTTAGNRQMLGNWWPTTWNTPVAIAKLMTWDNNNPYWPSVGVDFIASTNDVFWRWMHTNPNGTGAQIAMDLDYMHRLTLPKRNATSQGIFLDPEAGVISVNGAPVVTTASAGTQLSSQFFRRTDGGIDLALGGQVTNASGRPPQIVLGTYNDTTLTPPFDHSKGVLIVGSGKGPAAGPNEPQRQNGLRILADGTVLIAPKGDVEMRYRNGEPP